MDMVFHDLLLFYLVLDVSLLVLIKHNVLCLVPFLCQCVSFIEHSHCLWQRLCQIRNERLSIHIRWWKVLIHMLDMLCLLQGSFLLILFLLFWVIKTSINGIISMGLPIFIVDFSILLFDLFFNLLLMMLLVDIRQDVKLLLIVSEQLFLPFNWELYLSILEVKIWHFLIINNIVGIPYRSKMPSDLLLDIWFIGLEVDNIEIFLILHRMFLSKRKDTK